MKTLRNEHGDQCRDLDPDPETCRDCSQPLDECVCMPNNATNETRCAFIWDWNSSPKRCYQCGELEEYH